MFAAEPGLDTAPSPVARQTDQPAPRPRTRIDQPAPTPAATPEPTEQPARTSDVAPARPRRQPRPRPPRPSHRSPRPRPPSRRPAIEASPTATAPKTSTRQPATQVAADAPGVQADPSPAPSPTAPAPPASPAAGDTGLEALLAAWPAIVERLSQHPPTKPLIVKCRPVAVDGAIVTLGFPEEQAFLKEQAERRRPGSRPASPRSSGTR